MGFVRSAPTLCKTQIQINWHFLRYCRIQLSCCKSSCWTFFSTSISSGFIVWLVGWPECASLKLLNWLYKIADGKLKSIWQLIFNLNLWFYFKLDEVPIYNPFFLWNIKTFMKIIQKRFFYSNQKRRTDKKKEFRPRKWRLMPFNVSIYKT